MPSFLIMILHNGLQCLLQNIPVLFHPIGWFLLVSFLLLLSLVWLLITHASDICFYDLLTDGLLLKRIFALLISCPLQLIYQFHSLMRNIPTIQVMVL